MYRIWELRCLVVGEGMFFGDLVPTSGARGGEEGDSNATQTPQNKMTVCQSKPKDFGNRDTSPQ